MEKLLKTIEPGRGKWTFRGSFGTFIKNDTGLHLFFERIVLNEGTNIDKFIDRMLAFTQEGLISAASFSLLIAQVLPCQRKQDFDKYRRNMVENRLTRLNASALELLESRCQRYETSRLNDAIDLMMDNYDFIQEEMERNRAELSGIITEDIEFEYNGPGEDIMVPPEKRKCFGPWHSHPHSGVLNIPLVDIYFNPPSLGDVYFALLGAILGKYNYSFVMTIEGLYVIEPLKEAINAARKELDRFIKAKDPWRVPAEPIVREGKGEIGYDFHGKEGYYPYLKRLLPTKISWDFNTLDDAVADYKRQMAERYINIIFVPH